MFKLLSYLAIMFLIGTGVFVIYNSQRTFEAKFKNIDGLPKGARVTALGVKVGKVIRTKPTSDGIIVTVKITNKSFPHPEPGSQLTITSFRPNQGRVLEVIPPHDKLPETKAWIIQEPITTESWLHASLDLAERLKSFSETIIKHVTPENFEAARTTFSRASQSLTQTTGHLIEYESNLINLKNKISNKSSEANSLLLKTQKPIESLNQIINNKNIPNSLKKELTDISSDLNSISKNISSPDFATNLKTFKVNVLDNLNKINASLISSSKDISDPTFAIRLKSFNHNLEDLNVFYENLNKKDIKKITRESVRNANEKTTGFLKNLKQN